MYFMFLFFFSEKKNMSLHNTYFLENSCILDLLFEVPISIIPLLYPEINKVCPNGIFKNIDKDFSPSVDYTPNGILGLTKIENGEYMREIIRLIFSQALRVCYKYNGKKHGNLVILVFLCILDQSKSLQLAIKKDIENICSKINNNTIKELYPQFLSVLEYQSKLLRRKCFHKGNIFDFISNYISLMRKIWTSRDIENCNKYLEGYTIEHIDETDVIDFDYNGDFDDFSD